MEAKYKIGDLVVLNEFGRLVIDENKERVGLIVRGPVNLVYPLYHCPEEEKFCYWSYDIMIGEELITHVPQEFLKSMTEEKKIGDK